MPRSPFKFDYWLPQPGSYCHGGGGLKFSPQTQTMTFVNSYIGTWQHDFWIGANLGVTMKCPACDQTLKRIEGVCGEYICINPECPENKKARTQKYAEFYGLTQTEIYANYRITLAKNKKEK